MRLSSHSMTRIYWARSGTSTSMSFSTAPTEGELVVEIADVVQPVEESHNLVVLLPLTQFLRAPMQIADVGLHVHDPLTINRQHHAKHAVGSGVLRSHVQHHLYGFPGPAQ